MLTAAAVLAAPWALITTVLYWMHLRDQRELRYYRAHQRRLTGHQERAALYHLRPHTDHVQVMPGDTGHGPHHRRR